MEPIRSGPTTECVVRAAVLGVLVNGFAAAFLWDGHTGYARQNARQIVRSLGRGDDTLPPIDPALTSAEARRRLLETPQGTSRVDLERIWGPPVIEHSGETYYLGPSGHVLIRWEQNRVATIAWVKGRHSETDQLIQRWLGYGLGMLGVLYLLHFMRVVTTRVLLTDAGLQFRGRATIPWDAVKALRGNESARGRRIEIEYNAAGRSCVLRLDSYHIRALLTIVTAVCQRNGFEMPFGLDKPGAEPGGKPSGP